MYLPSVGRQEPYQQGIAVRHDGKYLRSVVAGHLQDVTVLLVRTVRTVHLEVATLVHLHTGSVITGEGGQAGVIVNTVGEGEPAANRTSQTQTRCEAPSHFLCVLKLTNPGVNLPPGPAGGPVVVRVLVGGEELGIFHRVVVTLQSPDSSPGSEVDVRLAVSSPVRFSLDISLDEVQSIEKSLHNFSF